MGIHSEIENKCSNYCIIIQFNNEFNYGENNYDFDDNGGDSASGVAAYKVACLNRKKKMNTIPLFYMGESAGG